MATCPLCHSTSTIFDVGTTTPEAYFQPHRPYAIAAGEGTARLPLWRCSTCGHGFTPLAIPARRIEQWYAASPPDTAFLQSEGGRRTTARQVLRHLAALVPERGRLLDVGAGPGFFVAEAQHQGWDAAGLELAPWAVTYARQTLQLSAVQQGSVGTLENFAPRSFKVVTAFDVIEHLPEPRQLVAEAARVLQSGGILVLTTPRFDSLLARVMGRRWYCIFPAHLHLFSRASLTRLLASEGFTIRRTARHTRHLSTSYLWHRLRAYLNPRHRIPARLRPGPAIPVNFGDELEIYAQLDRR